MCVPTHWQIRVSGAVKFTIILYCQSPPAECRYWSDCDIHRANRGITAQIHYAKMFFPSSRGCTTGVHIAGGLAGATPLAHAMQTITITLVLGI